MRKIRFPVVDRGHCLYPEQGKCLCGKSMIDAEHVSEVVLNVGALRRDGKNEWSGLHNDLGGIMSLQTHHHGDDTQDVCVNVVNLSVGGQADLTFCSFDCARTFLHQMVDELEARWRKANGK